MRSLVFIITLSGSLALVAPTASAATGSNGQSCSASAKHVSAAGISHTPSFSLQHQRALQSFPDGWGVTTQPARTTCAVKKPKAFVAPNHYQVLRNSY
jgi:hypothetical protein